MKDYRMVCQTTTGSLQWEYSYTSASNEMAIGYAASHAKQFAGVRWFMALLVFTIDKEEGGELIAICTLAEPGVKVEYKP